MWKLVIPTMLVALTGCGGGGGDTVTGSNTSVNTSVNTTASVTSSIPAISTPAIITTVSTPAVAMAQAVVSTPLVIGKYKNEIASSQVFNSAVADLNGDGLEDVVVSGWTSAPAGYASNRSGMVYLKILIQQADGSLVDKTSTLIGSANSTIWGSQRILIGDFDNDGRPDIAVLGFQDGQSAALAPSAIFWNNGNSFTRSDLLDKVSAHAACAGDLNGDGLIDLVTGSVGNYRNTIYTNQGSRQFVNNHDLTQESISSGGACAIIKDKASGNVAVVTTNLPLYPSFSAVVKVWDKNFNFVKTLGLPGSEESGTNIEIYHDLINVIPVDINNDGKIDLIVTDNGNYRLSYPNGSMQVLINQGDFVFSNETDKYLPKQSKTAFYNYYHTLLTIDGYPSIYLDHSGKVSLWQIKNGSLVKYKEEYLNSLTSGYQYTNIYKTKNGLSLFLIDTSEYPYAKFVSRAVLAQ